MNSSDDSAGMTHEPALAFYRGLATNYPKSILVIWIRWVVADLLCFDYCITEIDQI